jgi:hypothetical protein
LQVDWIHRRGKEVDAIRQQIVTLLGRYDVPEVLEPMAAHFSEKINDVLQAYYGRRVSVFLQKNYNYLKTIIPNT